MIHDGYCDNGVVSLERLMMQDFQAMVSRENGHIAQYTVFMDVTVTKSCLLSLSLFLSFSLSLYLSFAVLVCVHRHTHLQVASTHISHGARLKKGVSLMLTAALL